MCLRTPQAWVIWAIRVRRSSTQSTVDEAFRNQIGDLGFPADLLTAGSNFLPFVTPEAVQLYNDFEKAPYAAL
jgi:hypothetical protein